LDIELNFTTWQKLDVSRRFCHWQERLKRAKLDQSQTERKTMSTTTVNAPSYKPTSISRIRQILPAASEDARQHFSTRLTFETDCADVYAAQHSDTVDFVLVDVRNAASFAKGHVPGAINIPTLNLTEARLSEYEPDTVFVVYCAGPHCNGANKAALRLATLNRPVKEMIGGALGWVDEGFTLVTA
jgi:rhodanese-related sulfurtransferase